MKKLQLLLALAFCFTINLQAQTITTFSPASGAIGSSVTITGTNFNTTAAQNIVFFGATKAVVTAASATSLTVTVPLGATYQYLTVTNLATGLTAYSAKPFIVTLAGDIAFIPRVGISTSTFMKSVSIGDIDGDGKADLVVVNFYNNTGSVFRNTSTSGSVSFATKVDFATGLEPQSVSIGDLDGDGKPDLVVANNGTNTVSVFRNTSTSGSISVATKVDYTTGYNSSSLSIGDFDGDGKPDLAVTNDQDFTVSVLRNTSTAGNINFATKVDFTTGSVPFSVSIGDIDGDGKPDLATANNGSNNVSVLRNTSTIGSVSFATKVDFATGSLPYSVSIGDIDGDGKPDLAVANFFSDKLSVLRNTSTSGSVSFATKIDFVTGSEPRSVSIGDIDGDGKPDLAVANANSNTVSVLRNTSTSGSISFSTKIDFTTGLQPKSVSIGDIDGDGKPDLTVAGSSSISVIRQGIPLPPSISSQSTASQTQCQYLSGLSGFYFSAISVTATGDGLSYQWYSNASNSNTGGTRVTNGGNSNSYLPEANIVGTKYYYCVVTNPIGTVTSSVSGAIITLARPTPSITGAANVNYGNTVTLDAGSFTSYLWSGTGATTRTLAITASGAYSYTVTVTDNNGCTGTATASGTIYGTSITSFSPASGAIGSSVTITGTNFNTTAAQNIVFFGATRAVVTAASATSLTVTVPLGATYQYLSVTNLATGLTAYSLKPFIVTLAGGIVFNPKVDFATGSQPESVSIGDIDGDGKPDLATANANANTVSVLRNTSTSGSVSFATKVDFVSGRYPYSVSIGDIDGDGKPDLAVLNINDKNISVFRNTSTLGSVSFATKVDFVTGPSPWSISIGDLDGDGKPDLAVVMGTTGYNRVSVFRNTSTIGSVSFIKSYEEITGTNPRSVCIGDIDSDGKPDLAVANFFASTLSVFRNTSASGSISFATRVDFASGLNPELVSIGDIDGDGKPDLATANANANTSSVLRNTSTSGSISFATKVDLATGSEPSSINIGDIDGDGKPDLATANYGAGNISVLRNTSTSGSVSFATKVDFTTGTNPRSVSIGDIDGDGKPDLQVVMSNGSNTLSVIKQTTSTSISSQSTATQTQCLNSNFSAISVTAAGDALSYQWYSNASNSNSGGTTLNAGNGAQTNTYTPQSSVAGTLYYYCVVTGTSGTATSSVSGAFITNTLPTLSANGGGAATVCVNATTPAFTNAQAGGAWSIVAGTGTASVSTGGVVTGLTAGTVSVKYIYSNGTCSNSVSSSVSVNALPTLSANGGGAATVCVNATTAAFTNAQAGGAWSIVAGTGTASVSTGGVVTGLTAGTVSVKYTYSNGTCSNSVSSSVTVNALPTLSSNGGGAASVCVNATTAAFTNAQAGGTWSIVAGTGTASVSIGGVVTGLTAGTVSVVYTYSNGTCSNSVSSSVTVNALPTTPTITAGGATTFCSGGSVVLTASAGTTYLWSNNATTQAITVTNAGSYTVQVTNASGCQSAASAATVVTISESLIPGTISSIGETICYNGDPNPIVNNALAMDGQDDYAIAPASVWFNGNYTIETWIYPRTFSNWGRVIDFGNGPGVDNVLLGYTEGTSGKPSLVNFGAGGVGSLTSSTQLVLNQWSHLAVSFNGTTATMYINGALVATGTMTAPNNVNRTSCLIGKSNFGPGDPNANAIFDELRIWNVARSLAEIQASMNVPLSGSETGLQAYYNFDHGIANGNNTSVTTLTDRTSNVRNATLNNVALTGTNSNFVSGSPVTTNATGGSGTITYKWQANGVDIANSNATTYDPPAGLTATTTYRRFAKDESCQTNFTPSTGSYVVSVNTLPTAPISGNTSFCTGGSTILTSNATAGSGTISSYQWKVGGVNVASGGTSATYTSTAAGSYTVTVTNNNGCSFTSSAYVVSVNALPTAPISGNTSFCNGASTVLSSNATAGSGTIASYQWQVGGINVASGGTSATYTATAAGSYTVTVTNSNGCSFTSSAYVVSVNALPTLTIGSAITPANGATTADLTAGVSSDGTIKYYSDNAYTMEVTAPTVVTIARTYYIRATLNGCSTDDSRVVNDFSTAIAPPTITSFTPSSGNPGTLVTITGTDLGNSSIAFTIGGTPAIVISKTSTSLVGMVMPGSSTGTISISNVAGIVTNSESFTVTETPYPSVQQGNKLVGIGAAGFMTQGTSVSMSADGNTAIVGGSYDNGNTGAAWVYTKSGNTWSSQGSKLVATDATGNAQQGISVSLSADGNTAIVGGNWDNGEVGAAWVYTRSGSTWTQQGNKLVGTGANGNSWQGISVSLSADGNTAMVGGANDNNNFGAVWVYTRSGNTWTQQGSKLVGTDAVGTLVQQGWSVALSADGNTALVGGYYDNNGAGAAWVYTRSGNTWTQQGSKLVGTDAVGTLVQQGWSVALSANGNTAIVGGNGDNNFDGAAWVYTRSGSTWTQQGSKLVGTGVVGTSDPFGGSTGAAQGSSVSLSADGNTAMVGGTSDNSNAGATWVYTRSGTDWTQQGSKLVVTGAVGTYVQQGASVSLSADGKTAMVGGPWDNDGAGAAWVYVVGNSVTYDGNGNTGGSVPVVVSAVNGASITLASNSGNLVKTGYTFEGWNTAANGSGTSYAAGASYTLSGDVRLYAKWTAITYRITAAAGAGGSISPATALVNAGSTNAYTITPEAGYLISDVTVDDTPATALTTGSYAAGGTYVFTDVQTDHTINVTFALACDNVGLVAATATSSSICADATTTLTYSGLTGTNALVTWTQFEDGTGTTYGTGTPSSAVGPGTYYAYATGDCGSAVSIAVTVATTPKTDPTFAQVAPICSGATMADLPPTSSNAVTGTWSPALNNLEPTQYTFTPTEGQCANTATMTITVNPKADPTFGQVAPICSGATMELLPTLSNNGIEGTWSPALNNLENTEYTFTPTEGQCANTATMTIVVTPKETPTFTQVAPVCSGATLEALVTLSNNGIEGTWSPALNNLENTEYTFTPTEGQCATTAKMTITVTPNVFYYADTDGDGFGNPAVSQQSCTGAPIGYVTNNTDCDDTDAAIYPNSTKTIPIGLLTGANVICNGTSVTYTIDPVANATSYQWTLPTGATGTSTSTSIAVTFGSTYTVGNLCVQAVNGACLSATTCLTISPFTAVPALPGLITGPVTIAPNTTKTYTIVPVANATSYVWTAPANATLVSGQGTTSATFDFGLGYTTGTITVKASNCKGNSATRSLSVKKVGVSALRATQCGATLAAINTTIYANSIPGATKYRFEVSNGGTSQSFETTNYYFNLTQLTVKPNYNTAYPIRVAVLFDNVWQDYGSACTVTTPFSPLTKVKATQCGQTLAFINSTLSADVVVNANKYQFEIRKNDVVVQELTSDLYYTRLTNLTAGANYGTTYSIRVRYSFDTGVTWSDYGVACSVTTPVAPLTTKVKATQCGQTLALINSTLSADVITYANKYQFEISKDDIVVQELTSDLYYTRLTNLAVGAEYGTTYSIRVRYSFDTGTTWSDYGTSCTVTTPAAPLTTKVKATQCGQTLSLINSTLSADVITYANKYQFEISKDNAVIQELTSSLYYTRLTNLTATAQYGTTYGVRVRYSFDNGTTWSDYGASCSVTTPVAPLTTKVKATQCGQTLALINSTLSADVITYANKYQFEISKDNAVIQELTSSLYYTRLTNLTAGAQNGTTYSIRVRYSFDNGSTWSAYGIPCNVTSPSAQGLVIAARNSPEATIAVYPNPYSSTFKFATSFEGTVNVRIVDITGKLIEQFDVDAAELATKEMGEMYVPGMYQVTVSQATQIKNFKIVKSN